MTFPELTLDLQERPQLTSPVQYGLDGLERVAYWESTGAGLYAADTLLRGLAPEVITPLYQDSHDVAIERVADKLAISEQHYRATHDELTHVLNLAGFNEYVRGHYNTVKGSGAVYIDLTHFKRVNDEHGHAIGDEILVIVADALQSCVRYGDQVARIGGDELIALLTSHGHSNHQRHESRPTSDMVTDIGHRVQEKVAAAITNDYPEIAAKKFFDVAVGDAVWRRYDTVETLKKRAEIGMYKHKEKQHESS